MCQWPTFLHWSDWATNPNNTLMQFTGLHDKNGKEIYEGDILDCPVTTSEGSVATQVMQIIWWEEQARFTMFIPQGRFPLGTPHPISEAVVIGNIYENPELLNAISS